VTGWIYEYCPAKLNLFLQVTDRREDGYHNLVSLAGFTRFSDRLDICPAPQDRLTLTGPFGDALLHAGGDTIISRLVRRLRAAGYDIPPLDINLQKHIPLGGGLGGGSADGAGLLRALIKLNIIEHTDEINQIASTIGADLAVCIRPAFQMMRDTGTVTEPLMPPQKPVYCVLANPALRLSTPHVFAGLAPDSLFGGRIETAQIEQMLTAGRWAEILAIGNNLTEAAIALAPEIGVLLSGIRGFGTDRLKDEFMGAAMSGSGASCFALLTTKQAADRLAAHLDSLNFWSYSTELIEGRFF
jgi:4-diphosphocytidyl-2-C-methyl-D-erythritol kinase